MLLEKRVQACYLLARFPVLLANFSLEPEGCNQHQRHDRQRDDGEHPTQGKHEVCDEQQFEHMMNEFCNSSGYKEAPINKLTDKCPECSSMEILPITYGLPSGDALEAERNGELILGGCNDSDIKPDYRCKQCDYEWRISKYKLNKSESANL